MRLAGVCPHRDDRIRIAHEPLLAKPSGHQLLNVVFGRRRAATDPLTDGLEGAILDAVEHFRRPLVCLDRCGIPARREPLDEIARRHDLDAELTDELDGPCIDAGDVRDRALG